MESRVRDIRESRGLPVQDKTNRPDDPEIAEHMARIKLGFKQLVSAVNAENDVLTCMAVIDLQYYLENFGVHYGFNMGEARENLLEFIEKE